MIEEGAEWIRQRKSLSWEITRWQLLRAQLLARRGRRHPDPEIDSAVLRWAENVLFSVPMYPDLQAKATLGLLVMFTDGLTGRTYGKYSLALMDRTDRRHARHILRVHGMSENRNP